VLSQAVGTVLPAAVGVALSPIPIIAVVLMLGTPRARANGVTFAVGWVTGLVAVSVVVIIVAGGAADADSTTATTVNWVKVGLGVIFLVMAAREWRKRPKPGEEAEMPAWLVTVDETRPPRALLLGVLLSAANPKNLALTVAAASSIAASSIDAGEETLAVAIFVVIGSVTVVGAVLAYLVAGERAAPLLASLEDFMIRNSAVIMFVLLLVLGAKLIGDGLSPLG
jgi:threonine/homoserine/homoserine lactone efflux protein